MPRRNTDILPVVIFLAGAVFYILTLVQGAQPADSGEFQWVGATLGLAHPPGFPLYTLLAFGAVKILGMLSPALAVTTLSAIFSGATLSAVYLATTKIAPKIDHRAVAAGGVVAALSLATSTTFWAQATTANIRSLTLLFAALTYGAVIQLANERGKTGSNWRNPLVGFALAIGLGVTHHLSLAFIGLIMGGFAVWLARERLARPKQWAVLLLVGVIAALPWLYLPWRSPDLRTWGAFWEYALGLGFRGDFFYFRTWPILGDRLAIMGDVFRFQFSDLTLLGAIIGGLLLVRRRPILGWLMITTWAVQTLITATYRAPQAVEYLLPAYLPIVISLGFGSALVMDRLLKRGENSAQSAAGWLVPLLFAALAVNHGIDLYPSFRYLSNSRSTEVYVNEIMELAPSGSVVLADWHWYTPLQYQHQVIGARPDVAIEFVFPQTASYGGDWAAAIAQNIAAGRSVVATHNDPAAYSTLPPPQPLGEAALFAPDPPQLDLRSDFAGDPPPLNGVTMTGWSATINQNEQIIVHVSWLPEPAESATLRVFAQLRDDAGRPVALVDQPLPNVEKPFVSRLALTPLFGTAPGPYRLVVGIYDAAQPTTPAAEVDLTALTIGGSRWAPITDNPVRWRQATAQRTLIGYDWDHTLPGQARLYWHWQLDNGRYWSEAVDVPSGESVTLHEMTRGLGAPRSITIAPDLTGHYVPFGHGIVWLGNRPPLSQVKLTPGTAVVTRQRLASSRPVERDIGFAVRLIGLEKDNFTWAWLTSEEDFDIPALGAVPTLKWVAGTQINHPRRLTIAPQAVSGQAVEGFLRPYDVMTNQPLPILDGRFAASGRQWVPFDTGTVGD